MENQLIYGDCFEVMKDFEDNSIDLICSDIPYGLTNLDPLKLIQDEETKGKGFMGKDWDNIPSTMIFKECYRILKDGAFMFLQFTPRQDAVTVLNYRLLQAGFNINFTSMFWVYGTGFPKAIDISKALDKKAFYEWLEEHRPQALVFKNRLWTASEEDYWGWRWCELARERYGELKGKRGIFYERIDFKKRSNKKEQPKSQVISGTKGIYSLPSTPEAKQFDGSYGGCQVKPALELIIVAMKKLSEKTFTEQALKNGKGITWLDDCRIPYKNENDKYENRPQARLNNSCFQNVKGLITSANTNGRFPANIIVSDDVLNDGEIRRSQPFYKNAGDFKFIDNKGKQKFVNTNPGTGTHYENSFSRYFDLDAFFEKKLSELPERVQKTFPFYIVSKPSKAEKNKGCEELEAKTTANPFYDNLPNLTTKNRQRRLPNTNNHPTVKPFKLYSYLITMGSREGDVVLDPFAGSGTTCLASAMLNRKYIGIEKDAEYYKIAEKRINEFTAQQKLF